MSGDIEEKAVELSEIKAGLKLKAGHRVHLIVNGVHGSRPYGRAAGWDEDGSNDAAGRVPGAAGGDEEGSNGAPGLAPGTPGGMEDGAFVIELQLHAAGGTPLAHERVRIHDPDTGEQIGSPGVTDENGVLRARVPAEKEYHLHLDTDAPGEDPDMFGDHEHPLAGHLPHPDEHAVLHVAFFDSKGAPLKGEAVQVKDEHGQPQELKTDENGTLDLVVDPGLFTLETRGASFVAHSVFSGDLVGDGAPYRFVVP
jgi:hypothetical protein